jgi:DNA-binding MarR family transcriptional regulator
MVYTSYRQELKLPHRGKMSLSASPPELRDPLADMLGYQLRRASLLTLTALGEAFAELKLTLTEAAVIRMVQANPGCNQAEISRALGVKRTNMVPVIAGLVDARLIRRKAADGRTHALNLTRAGNLLHDRIAARSLALERHFFGDMDASSRQLLLDLLQRIRAKAVSPPG